MTTVNSIYGSVDDLFLFCSVAAAGSASLAASRLNMPPSTLSRRLDALEKRLGTSLLKTQKRELVPTEAGLKLYETIAASFWQIDSGVSSLQKDLKTLAGLVRITVPRAFYYDVVRHVVREMAGEFPELSFDVTMSQFPDEALIESRADIIMVFNTDRLTDCIAHPLYRTKLGIFVGKDFFTRHERPKTVEDLAHLPWVHNYAITELPLYEEDHLITTLSLMPRLVINDIHCAADEIREGNVIGVLPMGKTARHRDLIRIFPTVNARIRQAYLVCRSLRYRPRNIEETMKRIEKAAAIWYSTHDDWVNDFTNVVPEV